MPHVPGPDLDVAYGFKKKDGRMALYTVALDGSDLGEHLARVADVAIARGLARKGA